MKIQWSDTAEVAEVADRLSQLKVQVPWIFMKLSTVKIIWWQKVRQLLFGNNLWTTFLEDNMVLDYHLVKSLMSNKRLHWFFFHSRSSCIILPIDKLYFITCIKYVSFPISPQDLIFITESSDRNLPIRIGKIKIEIILRSSKQTNVSSEKSFVVKWETCYFCRPKKFNDYLR